MTGWTTTFRQTLPRLSEVLRHLRPTYERESVRELEASVLGSGTVRGVVWDVDGTLMAYHGDAVDAHVAGTFRDWLALEGVGHAILSNCDERRYTRLGRIFPTVPVLRAYRTPAGIVYRTLRGDDDSLSGDAVRRILHSGGSAVRKPSAALIELACSAMGGLSPARLMMIGDQYLTDVATANLGGARSVKVRTLHRASFPLSVRMLQRLDHLVYRTLYGS